jgi:hypothetical protein
MSFLSIETLKRKVAEVHPSHREAAAETRRDRAIHSVPAQSDEIHLKETAKWLIRAQDAGNDRGVSRAYSASALSAAGYKGWEPSYPETTGYIIPTMYALGRSLNRPDINQRAQDMANWEIGVQMDNGAVMGSVVTARPSPAVFNTGQVIFGWLSAHEETGDGKFLEAAVRAGNYLLSIQGADGTWRQVDSDFALKGATIYNTRVAWALILLGQRTDTSDFIAAGRRFIDYALSRQKPNGWFSDNCLNNPQQPLLHTIVYAVRGILEAGIILKDDRYLTAALKTLDALTGCQRTDGGIPGRLDAGWLSSCRWDCVTGDAQLAIAWIRACTATGTTRYHDAASNVVGFIKRTQNLSHSNLGIRGGVKGSYPFNGEYGQYEMLNWAAKFFCDALMLLNDDKLRSNGIHG